MQEETAIPNEQRQWRIEAVKDGSLAFDCPACRAHHAFEAKTFAGNPVEEIKGLKTTDRAVSRVHGNKFLPVLVGLVVYYFVHRWIYGPGVPLNYGIIIPVIAAAVAYTVSMPLFSAGLFSGRQLPVYRFECGKCQSEVEIATNGKFLALPVRPSETQGPSKTEDQSVSV